MTTQRVKVAKNKMAPPFRECEFDIMYGEGLSFEGDLLDLAVGMDVVEKSGMWYSYNGDRVGQGRDQARLFLKEHTDVADRVEAQVREKAELAPKKKAPAPAAEGETEPARPAAKRGRPKKEA